MKNNNNRFRVDQRHCENKSRKNYRININLSCNPEANFTTKPRLLAILYTVKQFIQLVCKISKTKLARYNNRRLQETKSNSTSKT